MTSTATVVYVTSHSNKSPGPTYSIPSFGSDGPKIAIHGVSDPNKKEEEKGPQYEMLSSTIGTGPKYTFGCIHKETKKQDQFPGPSYMPPAFGKEAPAYSFHSKHDVKSRKNEKPLPGPGSYDTPQLFGKTGKKFSMKSRVFLPESFTTTPGPAEYTPNYSLSLNSIPKCSIRSVKKSSRSVDITPAPGAYDIPSTFGKSKLSFHGVNSKEKVCQSGPGPGAYNTSIPFGSDSRKSAFHGVVSTSRSSQSLNLPYYSGPETFGSGPKPSFHGKRYEPKNKEIVPGPNYMPPAFGSSGSKFSIVSRHEAKSSLMQNPGPGNYNISTTIGQGAKFSIKNKENSLKRETEKPTPGPADYVPDYNKLMKSRASVIGKRIPEKKVEYPGGQYVLLPEINNGPKYSIGNRDKLSVEPGAF